jgi:hypothetical protein
MEKANRVLWRVKAQDELGLADSAMDPVVALHHRQRATEFLEFADQDNPPDIPLDSDI